MEQGRDDAAKVAGVVAARAAIAARRRADHELHTAVAELQAEGAAAAAGYRSLPSLLQDTLRINQAEATRLVDRAGRLTARASMTGEPLAPELPATAAACAAGVAGDGHVTVIVETMEHLGKVRGLDAEVLAAAEAALAEHAGRLAPAGLRRVALRLVDELDPDGAAPEEEPEPVDELHRVRRRDGSIAIKARIHSLVDAELLDEVFDALGVPAGADDRRTRPQRDAETLKELCAQAASPTGIATDTREHPATPAGQAADEPEPDEPEPADADTEHGDEARNETASEKARGDDRSSVGCDADAATLFPGMAPPRGAAAERSADRCARVTVSGRALLAITIDHRWLQQQVGHGRLDSEHAIDPATARRIACDAGIVPTILGSRGEPLDVGRLSYTVPEGMRRALHLRDGGCSFPGCTRRPRRCHAHHVRHWADGGTTELDNLTLLCSRHHHLIHHNGWTVTMIDRRPWFRPPTWIDPHQQPRPGGRFPTLHAS